MAHHTLFDFPTLLFCPLCKWHHRLCCHSCSEGSSNTSLARQGKRKRDKDDSELLQYLERSDERHHQSLEASRVVTNMWLEQISTSNTALLTLMGRVVTVMEAGRK
ncbi:unnamed protein product [Gadus morhua 'NCC']